MRYKLIVSDVLHFAVRFTLTDGAAERAYCARLAARRCPGDQLDAKLAEPGKKVNEFLAGQGLELLGWDGDSPLVDDNGTPAPVNPDALAALLAVPNLPNLVMGEYMVANGAKGKLGN